MELREGYKQTEVGVIPEDWGSRKLGELATFRTGPFGSALHKSDYTSSGIPIVNPMHILDGEIVPTQSMTLTEAAATALSEFRLKAGEVVIGRRGDMGRCAVVRAEHAGWLCGTGSMIVRPSAGLETRFLQRVLSSPVVISAIEDTSVGSTMINLNQATLGGLTIQVPPVAEQRAITTALSDVDALLAKLDQLITKKRDLKQAAMQQLLTGQTRLPGFSGKWEVKRLAHIAQINPGINKPVSEMGTGVLYVTVQDLYSGNSVNIERLSRIRLSVQETVLYALQPGDIVFGKSSVKRDGIAYPSIFRGASEPAVCTGFSYRARVLPDLADSNYVFYALRWEPTRKWLIEHSQASALTNINKAISDAIPISMPELAEQTAIASVLSDMDAELAALEARRNKTRALKQGMMQALLTGHIRLI